MVAPPVGADLGWLPGGAAGPGRNLRADTGHRTRRHRRTDRAVDGLDRYACAGVDPDRFDGSVCVDGSDDTVIDDDYGASGRAAGGTLTALGIAADPGETGRNSNAGDSHGRHRDVHGRVQGSDADDTASPGRRAAFAHRADSG